MFFLLGTMSETQEHENHVETSLIDVETAADKDEPKVETEYTASPLIYGVNENPPIHVTIICAFQVVYTYITIIRGVIQNYLDFSIKTKINKLLSNSIHYCNPLIVFCQFIQNLLMVATQLHHNDGLYNHINGYPEQ